LFKVDFAELTTDVFHLAAKDAATEAAIKAATQSDKKSS